MDKWEVMKDKIYAVTFGHAIGDALGVPVEFCRREFLDEYPVDAMMGYGAYPLPAGCWSDDTSMSICALDVLASGEVDLERIMKNFCRWYYKGEFTPTGRCFDIGHACRTAIRNYFERSLSIKECAPSGERSNGNGSLMRIYPFVLFYRFCGYTSYDFDELIGDASRLTHAHPRSILGCRIYARVLDALLREPTRDSVLSALTEAGKRYTSDTQIEHYSRIFDSGFAALARDSIRSTGYVVDTLEAALWCLLTTDSYKECVLKAVNLGDDTDSVGAVTGALAGALYGLRGIPQEWLLGISGPRYFERLCFDACNRWAMISRRNEM